MLDITSLIWTIPGFLGLLAYNRKLSRKHRQAEGWAYLFSVVVFAAPYYFILELQKWLLNYLDSSGYVFHILEPWINPLGLIVSIICSIWLANEYAKLKNKHDPRILDPFQNCCYLWKKKFVFITLENNKIYLALLLDWTQDLNFESTIRVLPFYSGYRDENGHICWTFEYPQDDLLDEKVESGLIISRKKIVTFSLWNHSEQFIDAPQVETLENAKSKKE